MRQRSNFPWAGLNGDQVGRAHRRLTANANYSCRAPSSFEGIDFRLYSKGGIVLRA